MILGLRWYGPVAVVAFVLSTILMLVRVNPFYYHFYDFAWYCYIVFADSLIYRWRGRSLLSNRLGEFALMLPLSWFVWEVFEGFNLRLDNWRYEQYQEVDGQWQLRLLPFTPKRIPLYFIAFATVLPGIFQTLELVRIWSQRSGNWMSRAFVRQWEMTQEKFDVFVFLGLACVALPMFWPTIFYPLIWLGMFFILDPINFRAGRPSILRELSKGNASLLVQLLLSGLICGGLWELWNFWAGTKWIYTVPWPLGELRLFEMPLLGYLGFPPFALECYAMYHFLRALPGIRLLAGERSMFAIESGEQ
ncbi:hypothetical protein FJY63_11755 [Candidatus Sumerlaeota bacterium]|nr:hypothetical protein [Candidatus Sumerlaeota bacterium]